MDKFEERKQDHIRLSLSSAVEAFGGSGFDKIQLLHEAMPELDFDQVDISTVIFDQRIATPFYVSSMTAGHRDADPLNRVLAAACRRRGWTMGVGSQRRQLIEKPNLSEWDRFRKDFPELKIMGNIGLSQAISSHSEEIQHLADSLQAWAMIVHANALQECLQPEGTPQFSGGYQALARLTQDLSVPVVWKETGCGVNSLTLNKLLGTGLAAVDVSGYGGTHWGRIEGARAKADDLRKEAAESFSDWGIGTVDAILSAKELAPLREGSGKCSLWASGGVRTGVDSAKCFALGADYVGFAKPALVAALKGEEFLNRWMEAREFELKTAMFCLGISQIAEFRQRQVWKWRQSPVTKN